MEHTEQIREFGSVSVPVLNWGSLLSTNSNIGLAGTVCWLRAAAHQRAQLGSPTSELAGHLPVEVPNTPSGSTCGVRGAECKALPHHP